MSYFHIYDLDFRIAFFKVKTFFGHLGWWLELGGRGVEGNSSCARQLGFQASNVEKYLKYTGNVS